MDRPDLPHNEAELSDHSDPISGLFTTIPNISRRPKVAAAAGTAATRSHFRSHWLLILGAAAPVLIAVISLTGWVFDVERFRSIIPGYAPMKPNTAIGIALCGISLIFLYSQRPALRKAAIVAASVVLCLAVLTGFQLVTGVDLRIDDLLIPAHLRADRLTYLGQMSPATATGATSVTMR